MGETKLIETLLEEGCLGCRAVSTNSVNILLGELAHSTESAVDFRCTQLTWRSYNGQERMSYGTEHCVQGSGQLAQRSHVYSRKRRAIGEVCLNLRAEVFELIIFGNIVDDGDHLDDIAVFPRLLKDGLCLRGCPFERTRKVMPSRHYSAVPPFFI
jgi:hypothetical protein